ncbi:uncharacterized protein LOC113464486 [Ceratina calcarata]|uniref:Uncharacterized protein LOC113464486 n=1 Tax=Ceratina calcarata TaxID=156304 RepID=A0AAJ7S2M7_9HYME|nr:uncharacterized protein LOC113464486 [Ceratina calcarata]
MDGGTKNTAARAARRSIRTSKVKENVVTRSFDANVDTDSRASQLRIEHHTRIFASMCPDEILEYYDDYNTRMYYTTLMLGDISGAMNQKQEAVESALKIV